MPVVGSPNPTLRLPPTWVQLIGPATFCAWPSMTTLLPTAADELLLAPVLDLLLEQPDSPATTWPWLQCEQIDTASSVMHGQDLAPFATLRSMNADAEATACVHVSVLKPVVARILRWSVR